jgi:hypothetical protein
MMNTPIVFELLQHKLIGSDARAFNFSGKKYKTTDPKIIIIIFKYSAMMSSLILFGFK